MGGRRKPFKSFNELASGQNSHTRRFTALHDSKRPNKVVHKSPRMERNGCQLTEESHDDTFDLGPMIRRVQMKGPYSLNFDVKEGGH